MHKILVVDDETDVEVLFRQRFRKEMNNGEFQLHFAFSGEAALEFMRGLKPFDLVLILSDINMPGMTGLELLRQTKAMFPLLKVMMISAYGDKDNLETAASLGADNFLTKPVNFDQLKSDIQQIIKSNS